MLDVDLVHDAGARRDDAEAGEGVLAPAQELEALAVALELKLHVAGRTRPGVPKMSATTEWSMTSSAGMSGLIFVGSPPSARIASRIAARSTTAGTPVRSCRITRAGVNWISVSGSAFGSQLARALMCSLVMLSAVLVAEQVLEQHLQAVREVLAARDRVQAVDLVLRAARLKRRAAAEAVRSHRRLSLLAQSHAVWLPAMGWHRRSSVRSARVRRALPCGGREAPGSPLGNLQYLDIKLPHRIIPP